MQQRVYATEKATLRAHQHNIILQALRIERHCRNRRVLMNLIIVHCLYLSFPLNTLTDIHNHLTSLALISLSIGLHIVTMTIPTSLT